MIQRIQTLYLSLAVLSLSLLITPLNNLNWIWKTVSPVNERPSVDEILSSMHHATNQMLELVLLILSLLLTLTAIFLFSNRKLQAQTGTVAMSTTFSALAIAAYWGWKSYPDIFPMLSWGPGAIFYLFGILMQNLAIKRIKRDDSLVRSMDRLR